MAVDVRLEGVTRRYRLGDGSELRAMDDVSLSFAAASRTAVVGASGSGKSTLLHLIGAIDSPDEGVIRVGEEEITSYSRRQLADYRAGIGFVFQQFHLIPALSALDNVAAPLVFRANARERRNRALEMLDAVGLAGRADARPEALSGGQQQRVAIARALVVQPSIVLADEPTGNLDSGSAEEILNLLMEVQERFAATLIIATHDSGVADRCDRIVRVQDGRVEVLVAEPGR